MSKPKPISKTSSTPDGVTAWQSKQRLHIAIRSFDAGVFKYRYILTTALVGVSLAAYLAIGIATSQAGAMDSAGALLLFNPITLVMIPIISGIIAFNIVFSKNFKIFADERGVRMKDLQIPFDEWGGFQIIEPASKSSSPAHLIGFLKDGEEWSLERVVDGNKRSSTQARLDYLNKRIESFVSGKM